MWGNMFRLAAEYVYLEKMFDYHPDATEPGVIEVGGQEIFPARTRKTPHASSSPRTPAISSCCRSPPPPSA
jgi:hypothetical protein